jgi:hypothetical protein
MLSNQTALLHKPIVDVLFVPKATVGDSIIPSGKKSKEEYKTIKVDKFFSFSIQTDEQYSVNIDGCPLVVNGKEDISVVSLLVNNAQVG